jgi:eukaryotic-like serine/threonine-protein kinase
MEQSQSLAIPGGDQIGLPIANCQSSITNLIMDAKRWNRIDELLGVALDLAPEARSGFLDQSCGDDDGLRLEVEKLLAAHEQASKFIETSAMKVAARAVAGETVHARIRQQIGPYRIVSLLGAGGMGEVYLAEDSRLARRVALKILPFPFTADLDRVRRFEREARAASALNHPNIMTIYDIGEADSIHYIATEYAEGATLRARLKTGPMPLSEAIKVALQVAEALGAAHAAGITHRDIKPENIVQRSDGYVKVLDFGLAKLTAQPVMADSLSPSVQTYSGLVVGTIKYMSPEQALGQPVDSRTDLWSLGVVLYEMVTGQAPFDGASQASIFDAILHHAPAPITDFDADLPAELDSISNRALEKDPELRYQTAVDLRADLRRLQRELEPLPSRWGRAATRLRNAKSRARDWRFVAALVIAVAVLAFCGWLFFLPEKPDAQVIGPDWTSAKSMQLTNDVGPEYFPNLSADGKGLIYASRASGNWDIYWQRVGGKNWVNLTKDSPADDTEPAYSPDGNYIAFRSERAPEGIHVMEATSENVRRVSDVGHNPSWSPNGKELVISVDHFSDPTSRIIIPSALWVIDVASGTRRLLTEGDAVQPNWSPNGYRIAYWGMQKGSGQRDIWTIPAGGGEAVPITNDEPFDWNPVWSPDAQYLYFASNRGGSMNFWRVAVDEKTGKVTGQPESVTTPSAYSQHISFSRDGKRMAYVQKSETENLQRIAFDPANGKTIGATEAVTQGTRYITSPDPSPDGEWLAYSSQGERQEDIFLIKKDGSSLRQLTNDHFNDRFPRWSPDGRRIAFYSDRSGRYEIWLMNADGAELQQLTFTSGSPAVYPVWSPDGSQIVYRQRGQLPFVIETNKPKQAQAVWQLPPPEQPREDYQAWSWSDDGHKLAGWWIDSAGLKSYIYIYIFETRDYEQIASFGNRPVWLHDNRQLLFHANGRIYMIDSVTRKLHEILSASPQEARSASLAPDERTLYYTVVRTEADIWFLSLDEPRR